MTEFERESLRLFERRQKEIIERNRKAFRRWLDPLRKLEPDYKEQQLEIFGNDAR